MWGWVSMNLKHFHFVAGRCSSRVVRGHCLALVPRPPFDPFAPRGLKAQALLTGSGAFRFARCTTRGRVASRGVLTLTRLCGARLQKSVAIPTQLFALRAVVSPTTLTIRSSGRGRARHVSCCLIPRAA